VWGVVVQGVREWVGFEEALAVKLAFVLPHLNERQRRLVLGAEARMLGRGGVRVVARAAGVGEAVVSRGAEEVDAGVLPRARIRDAGAGRRPLVEVDPELVPALLALICPDARGDPQSPLRWTTKSTRKLAAQLTAAGHRISADTVAGLLREQGFSLQGNAKTLEGKQHPDRDGQFGYINEQVKGHQTAGQPVVSVDTKKKELVGEFKNAGRQWRPVEDPVPVNTHDFPDAQSGKAIPYGVYDLAANTGWVNVGCDHDTAAFAAESLRRWWNTQGRQVYPRASRLLITADAGGSNGYRTRAWKAELARLAAETGLAITVCHFPPGTSKWNAIEHRLFSHISMNWRGRPLTSHEVILNTIAATSTGTGLRVAAELDTGQYPIGARIDDAQMAALALERHAWHGDWNYTVFPQPVRPTAQAGPDTPPARPDHAWLFHPAFTGMPTATWQNLIEKLAVVRHAQREGALHERRGGPRKTAPGTGRKAVLTLEDRALAAVLHRRFTTPQRTIATLLGVTQQTIHKTIGQTSPLLTLAGHQPQPTGTRLRTLRDVLTYATANGIHPPPKIQPTSKTSASPNYAALR
jgi:hypothetical protein